MRFVLAFAIPPLLIIAGLALATGFIAGVFDGHPALGAPLLSAGGEPVYSPFAVIGWTQAHAEEFPKPFAMARLIVLAGFATAILAFALLIRSRTKPQPFGKDAWGTFRDASEAGLFARTGTPLGKLDGEILCFDGPEHQLLVGASRSGKGRGHVVPTLLAWPSSALVLDVKGELASGDGRHGFPGTAGFRGTLGPVLQFAPTRPGSARFNPLFEVRRGANEVRDVQNIVDIIADPAGDGRHSDFWDKSAKQVLIGVIVHVLYAEPAHRKNLAVVREKLRDLKATAEEMGRTLHLTDPVTGEGQVHPEARHGSESFLANEERLQSGLKATAESFFGLFADPIVADMTSASDFRVADLMCGAKPATLYLQPPPSDAARLMPLMRLVLNQMARALMEHQETGPAGEKKNHRLLLCLDEFPQLGKLPFFETMMGAMAGYGIKAYLVCQSLNHITRAYGRDSVILDNCHILTAFSATDMETARRIAEMAGEAWEVRPQISEQMPASLFGPKRRTISYREERRPLLLPGDVRQLRRDEQLIFLSGTKPLRTKKLRFDEEPVFAKRLLPARLARPAAPARHDWDGVQPVGMLTPAPVPKPHPSSSPRWPASSTRAPSAQADLFTAAPARGSQPSLSRTIVAGLTPPPGHPATQAREWDAAADGTEAPPARRHQGD
ncbi:MAG: conjugal transfer protein TraG [Hyphomonas sp.]|uniref:type IV secretory system conjugative DNA transfer family protein n=1 Tax=Hyphomonas sp. TaxID=87 RepID=UPI0017F90B7E|nr:type IV secretory system conjugative DNA transfer family protein [Hyphomonas sp.]MBA3068805.1 conjugal transfer protein TraG [Hyphomonas sp.]MBU3921856.1 type IV secretory system conjugative DNA transfer family protein [Alphaproteobacteria bacterium]MBU4060517.1 type IV secretory system conjugative DNA transfer family protein [Alphaproteobacteria bacterium]MBU4162887.1 type IV secretory system conjugative DNA transfer family protein [Alphaproteobacteria bacterium]